MSHILTIDIQPGGYFIAKPDAVEVAQADVEAFMRGELHEDQRRAIEDVMGRASQILCFTIPMGQC